MIGKGGSKERTACKEVRRVFLIRSNAESGIAVVKLEGEKGVSHGRGGVLYTSAIHILQYGRGGGWQVRGGL